MNTSVLLTRLLEDDGPVWHRWNGDTAELLTAIRTELENPSAEWLRRQRLLWLLDRLSPVSDNNSFPTDRPMGLYGWGRRLPAERRHELVELAQQPLKSNEHAQALLYAWCDSCPPDQVESLLDWTRVWPAAFREQWRWYLPSPEREFHRRCPDSNTRRESLLRSLHGPNPSIHTFRLLLRDGAIDDLGSDPIPQSEQEWLKWFIATLIHPAFAHIRHWGLTFFTPLQYLHLAKTLWIFRHGPANWSALHQGALYDQDQQILDRLAEIVPNNELAAWDTLVLGRSSDYGQMRAFCRWLPASYVEVLATHFQHPDPDWAACAYQNWLAKAPLPILEHHWRTRDNRPTWQVQLLHRRLFAPAVLRPSPIVEDVQDVEADLRLEDPFNRRGL